MQIAAGKVFEKAPSNMYQAVLADIVDLGLVKSTYKGKEKIQPKVRLVWILNAKDKEGNNFRVMKRLTALLADKATLFSTIKDIIGSVPVAPFETETLIGKNSRLVVSLETGTDGKQYSNVKAILSPDPATPYFAVPADFVRAKDKKKDEDAPAQAGNQQAAPAQQEVADEEIPF